MKTAKTLIVVVAVGLFTASGFSALAYQAVLNKFFSYVFGVSSYAAATVLAAFMLGLATGSYLFGRLATNRLRRLFLWYGCLELLIGVYSLAFIPLADAVEHFYTPLARHFQLSLGSLTLIRFVSAVALIALPTALMGGSLPLLVEAIRKRGVNTAVNVLYAFNVGGAAIGTILSAYYLLPEKHLDGVLRLVFLVNLVVFLVAAFLEFAFQPQPDSIQGREPQRGRSDVPRWVTTIGFFSGFITFCNEVFWYHLLGLVVGNSTYAYAIMLFTTLVGMTIGGLLVRRLLARGVNDVALVIISQFLLAAGILVSIPLWDGIPDLFVRFGLVATSFRAREVLRFCACCLLILVPAISAGITFPVLLSRLEARATHVAASIGWLTAVNTAGAIVGSLFSGFFILSAIGGRKALFLSALLSILVVAFLPPVRRFGRVALLGGPILLWTMSAVLMPDWDVKKLLSGANIYFSQAHDDFDELVWQHEDYVGGITSIIRSGKVLTMLTNGKFQGNNGSEVRDQRSFALIPNLFVKRLGNALNIGLGTGTSLGVITQFPYREIDAVELSPDIVLAARRYFADVSFNALDQKNVHLHVEDGRNFLALNPREHLYDLISIELSSIWFAGVGNLYNDQFYALAKENMTKEGVLQQWIQLHHISISDIAVIIGTVRKHFKYVQLWLPGHQGILIASNEPLTLVAERLALVQERFPPADFFLSEPRTVLGQLLLNSNEIDQFLADMNRQAHLPLSSDINLYLEYSTPRGNILGWNYDENFYHLARYSHPDPRAILPSSMQADGMLIALARLGEAGLFPRYSSEWHERIDQALASIPNYSDRLKVKRTIVESLNREPRTVARPIQ